MKTALIFLLVCFSGLSAAPSTYTIYKCDPSFDPAMDANLSEWPEACFIDSLHSGDNCYSWDTTTPWTNADFQYSLYSAHDNTKVYFAIKNVRDDVLVLSTSTGCSDAFKINPGGQAMAFYMFFNGSPPICCSNPFTLGSTLFIGFKAARLPDIMPQVEFSLDKSVLGSYSMRTFQLSIGFEEGDTPYSDCMNTIYGAIGAEYTGNKQDWNASAWDNPQYYPTFNLSDSMVLDIEKGKIASRNMQLEAYPNPFNPATSIEYRLGASEKGVLSIYNVSGARLFSWEVHGQGNVSLNAAGLASGTYLVRLSVGAKTLQKRILYLK